MERIPRAIYTKELREEAVFCVYPRAVITNGSGASLPDVSWKREGWK